MLDRGRGLVKLSNVRHVHSGGKRSPLTSEVEKNIQGRHVQNETAVKINFIYWITSSVTDHL